MINRFEITGKIVCYFTDPALLYALQKGEEEMQQWIRNEVQEIIDEEGCGAVFCAMREWDES